jgi:hypothetical protein
MGEIKERYQRSSYEGWLLATECYNVHLEVCEESTVDHSTISWWASCFLECQIIIGDNMKVDGTG